jgi:hypothetical protein
MRSLALAKSTAVSLIAMSLGLVPGSWPAVSDASHQSWLGTMQEPIIPAFLICGNAEPLFDLQMGKPPARRSLQLVLSYPMAKSLQG